MQTWLNFWIFIFWLSFISFIINPFNFIFLLFFSEIIWIILYCFSILTGILIDDLNLLTLSFLILGFASVEFSFGYLLIILFKNFNKTITFLDSDLIWFNIITKTTNYQFRPLNFWKLKI